MAAADRKDPILHCLDAAAWAGWLEVHHDESAAVWLKLAKSGSPTPSVTQAEAVDEAVCFGWIDGQVARHDESFYLQRFTPRRPRSKWSAVNRERAQRLIAEGRMRPSGLAEFQAAQADGRLDDAYAPQSQATVPEDLQSALDAHRDAGEFFAGITRGQRYRFLYRLHQVKDPARRAERIANYIELLSRGETLG